MKIDQVTEVKAYQIELTPDELLRLRDVCFVAVKEGHTEQTRVFADVLQVLIMKSRLISKG